jgi:hypothetical protein
LVALSVQAEEAEKLLAHFQDLLFFETADQVLRFIGHP